MAQGLLTGSTGELKGIFMNPDPFVMRPGGFGPLPRGNKVRGVQTSHILTSMCSRHRTLYPRNKSEGKTDTIRAVREGMHARSTVVSSILRTFLKPIRTPMCLSSAHLTK